MVKPPHDFPSLKARRLPQELDQDLAISALDLAQLDRAGPEPPPAFAVKIQRGLVRSGKA
jgi:hypothetical protein